MSLRFVQRLFKREATGSIVLFFMAILAMLWANSSFAYLHQQFLIASLPFINDGLMAIFFLAVAMELKREILDGQFLPYSQLILPVGAAMGGMIVPALIYLLINIAHPINFAGWSTPVATDIAFALGALSLFGKRIPVELKLFLLALAIFDDVGAIIIIALFYSHGLSFIGLIASAFILGLLYLLNRKKILSLTPYLLLGVLLWLCLLHSGIHPTLAGVALAWLLPDTKIKMTSPLRSLEEYLTPWVAYLVLPLFALANAGFAWQGIHWSSENLFIVAGICGGLFIGKQIGVFGVSWLLIRLKWAKLPKKTQWLQLYGVSLLCGIGFTMSLFLGTLSFQNQSDRLSEVRLGVLIGSLLSGVIGTLILYIAHSGKKE
jgi:Na+:H+ antiporter, NhaA family